jgi:LmbE family N-acetylglucosaminyl deacetylase
VTHAVVVAPHPDDETLAAGGLIQRILRTGGTVRVVVLTAGDGYLEAAAALTGHDPPSHADYRALGGARGSEIHEAMATLGVRDLVLLDGPDDGLATLWASDEPYTSPHTGRGPFTNMALLDALRATIAAVHPTLVVGPDPRDHHPDHAAAGRFTMAAVAGSSPGPTVLTYLVHDTVWPPPLKTGLDLPVPGPEYAGTPWVTFSLTSDELATKRAALVAYRTQWPVIGGVLERFLRDDEVFAMPPR